MENYKLNGYLIQGGLYSWIIEQNSVYRGMGCGQPWPLDDPDLTDNDPTAASLTKMTEEYFPCFVDDHLGTHVIPDIEFINKYVAYCDTLNIQSRTLLSASKFEFPLLKHSINPSIEAIFLGFDYACNSFEFSILADDLSEPEIHELSEFRGCLNQHGLFDNPNDCAAYIESRRRLIEQGINLELDDDCTQFEVYEVPRGMIV